MRLETPEDVAFLSGAALAHLHLVLGSEDVPQTLLRAWLALRAVERPVSIKALHRALPKIDADQIATWRDAGQGAPVPLAASVLQAVFEDSPRDLGTALILADAALAQTLGWQHNRWALCDAAQGRYSEWSAVSAHF